MLSKTERILAIINYFLPHESLYQYHYEADSIAYNTRKNSSLKTVEKLVREYLPDVDENLYHQLAVAIKASLWDRHSVYIDSIYLWPNPDFKS